jgi:hypothetical protein
MVRSESPFRDRSHAVTVRQMLINYIDRVVVVIMGVSSLCFYVLASRVQVVRSSNIYNIALENQTENRQTNMGDTVCLQSSKNASSMS